MPEKFEMRVFILKTNASNDLPPHDAGVDNVTITGHFGFVFCDVIVDHTKTQRPAFSNYSSLKSVFGKLLVTDYYGR